VIVILSLIIKNQNITISEQNILLSESSDKLTENLPIVKLFDKPKPYISYNDWYRNKYHEKSTNTQAWNEYWDEVLKDEYFAWYIRKISRHPKFLVNLITEIQKFDFVKVSDYMKSVNWTWHDSKETPTTERMIDCIFTLAENLNTQNDKEGCESGGFCVKRMTDDKAMITFTFSYDD
jgi:hypothetical protein